MGILSNPNRFMSGKLASAAGKASDAIAKASALSPGQIAAVEKKREEYLSQMPSMDSEAVDQLMQKYLGAVGIEVYQAYLEQLKDAYLPVEYGLTSFRTDNRIRWFRIAKWVNDAEEKNLDKLVNVYQVLSEEDCNIALIYDRKSTGVSVYMGVVNTDPNQSDPSKADAYIRRLSGALEGNFPGVALGPDPGSASDIGIGIPPCLERTSSSDGYAKSVAIVSNLPSEKSEDFVSQSMEKLLDGIVPRTPRDEYTIVLLAKPISDQLSRKSRLFDLYSVLAPYASWQTNYTYMDSESTGSSATFGVNLGANAGVQYSFGVSTGSSQKKLYEENENDGFWKKVWKKIKGNARNFAGQTSPVQSSENNTNTVGAQAGVNFGVSFSRSSTVSVQIGMNEGITQTYTNYTVQHTLELIEKQMERLETCSALGMWEFAAYFIAENPVVANNAARMYLALTQGDDSYITRAAVNLYDGEDDKEGEAARIILDSVQRLQHPVFGLKDRLPDDWLMYPVLVTPSADISGKELAKSLNFPRKSVGGLPVMECVPFGREVQRCMDFSPSETSAARTLSIGHIYHMRRCETTQVSFDVDSFASHVFVTGSTGTGKSNTIFGLLDGLRKQGVKFLVVEPAKGEYKKVFGGECRVYGTNAALSPLLRINPFSFPEGIHVLEHIDRLVEIFNACWPMYAAMPAVLKDAVEKSYERIGWNLKTSCCIPRVFPTFADLLQELPSVMEASVYSADTKSDYAGALITRVKSLTNGINGQILCAENDLSDEELFEQDVIVDLSRVGSAETKSLLMGVIVMRLQEYRLHLDKMNERLVHVTVLEEAHNLLRKTAMGQAQESANLQGKSVEMLTNSIAEMRSFGEGFIIADQAPGLLDEAVIRNTNTKIVLRLPEESDRKIAGGSMALSENQIGELAKLPRGVAAVYQNDWVEAVLCMFGKYDKVCPLEFDPRDITVPLSRCFMRIFGGSDEIEMTSEDVDNVNGWISDLRVNEKTRALLRRALAGEPLNESEKLMVAYNVFDGKKIAEILDREKADRNNGLEKADRKISTYPGVIDPGLTQQIRNYVLQSILLSLKSEGELKKVYGASIENWKGSKL